MRSRRIESARDTLVERAGSRAGPRASRAPRGDPAPRSETTSGRRWCRRFRRAPFRCCSRTSRARRASSRSTGARFADMLAEHRAAARQQRSVTAVSSSPVRATPTSSPSPRPATRPRRRDAQAALAERDRRRRAWEIHIGEPEIHEGRVRGHRRESGRADLHARLTEGRWSMSERTRALLGDALECVPLGVHRLKDLRERGEAVPARNRALPSAAIAQRVEPAGAAVAARRTPRRARARSGSSCASTAW